MLEKRKPGKPGGNGNGNGGQGKGNGNDASTPASANGQSSQNPPSSNSSSNSSSNPQPSDSSSNSSSNSQPTANPSPNSPASPSIPSTNPTPTGNAATTNNSSISSSSQESSTPTPTISVTAYLSPPITAATTTIVSGLNSDPNNNTSGYVYSLATVIGGLVLLTVAVAFVFCYKRRRKPSEGTREIRSNDRLLTIASSRPPSYTDDLVPSSPGTSVVYIQPTSPDLNSLMEAGSIYKPAFLRGSLLIDDLPPIDYSPGEYEYEND